MLRGYHLPATAATGIIIPLRPYPALVVYNRVMTVAPPEQPGTPAKALTPSAVAQAQPSAVFGLGEVLKTIIHNSRTYVSENDVDKAVSAVEKFVGAFTTNSDLKALATGEERAAKEDVTQRVAPGGVSPSLIPAGIDYDKLAAALLAAQAQQQKAVGQ